MIEYGSTICVSADFVELTRLYFFLMSSYSNNKIHIENQILFIPNLLAYQIWCIGSLD